MKSVEIGKSFLQETFYGDGLLVVVHNTANRMFVAYACAKIKVSFVIPTSALFFAFQLEVFLFVFCKCVAVTYIGRIGQLCY